MKSKLRVFSSLARTGGTLVSRCIGCMQGVALLSEIHPSGDQVDRSMNILRQAIDWYDTREAEKLANATTTFAQVTQMIARELKAKNRQLVIRDWAHLDFMAVPFLPEPCHESMLVKSLQNDFDITQFHLVRHPVPQWLSTNRLDIVKGKLSLEQFLEGHYRYSLQCAENGFVRYEDFCDNPLSSMQLISDQLDISFDPDFLNKWPNYFFITGDTIEMKKRANSVRIEPVRVPAVDADFYRRLHGCQYYHQSLELLGYGDVQLR